MEQWKLLAIERIDKTIEGFREYLFYKRNYVNLMERCPICAHMLEYHGIIMNPMIRCINKKTGMECPAKDSCAVYLKIRRSRSRVFISILRLKLLRRSLNAGQNKPRFGYSKHLCRTCYNRVESHCYLGRRHTFFVACKLWVKGRRKK